MAMPQREPEVREERAAAAAPHIGTMNFTLAAFLGLGALVLAIIALANVVPLILSVIALLALGAAQWLTGLGLMRAADLSLPAAEHAERPRLLGAGPVPKGIGAWFLGGSFAILLGILGLVFGSMSAWVSVGVLLTALALFFGGGWSVVRGLAPGRMMRNLQGAGEVARGSDLWGAVIATVLSLMAIPVAVAVITGTPAAANAPTVSAATSQTLIASAILLLGATFFVSGLLRAWAYGRTRV